ncbi:MAG: hypothetical protein AB7T49_11930 [Oligoflexales bacterium]
MYKQLSFPVMFALAAVLIAAPVIALTFKATHTQEQVKRCLGGTCLRFSIDSATEQTLKRLQGILGTQKIEEIFELALDALDREYLMLPGETDERHASDKRLTGQIVATAFNAPAHYNLKVLCRRRVFIKEGHILEERRCLPFKPEADKKLRDLVLRGSPA